MKPIHLIAAATLSIASVVAQAQPFKAPADLSTVKPQQLCVHYTEQNEAEKKRFFERLNSLNLLSHKDYDLIQQGRVEVNSSICGMYMAKGKPLKEDGIQIRPMVFKVVHIYEDAYVVTQSGLVVEVHERKEGEIPPTLKYEMPNVVPPPMAPQTR